jgi:hypothetical protein
MSCSFLLHEGFKTPKTDLLVENNLATPDFVYAMVAFFEGLPQPALKRETFAPGFVSYLGGLNIRPAIVNLIFET